MLHAHRHERAYVALVLDGGYQELSADGAWFLEPGDVVVHPPHHFHANSFNRRTKVLNLRIPDNDARSDEFQSYSVLRTSWSSSLPKAIHDVAGLREKLAEADSLALQEPDNWVDSMAMDLAADSNLRIADLAGRYRVTREHASRKFRQRYFMTPATFRSERRFRFALDLLRRTKHSLCEISQIAGYADQAHFCRVCLAISGFSPGRLRRLYSQDQFSSRPGPGNDLGCC